MEPGVIEVNERSKPIAVAAGLLFVVYTLGWFVNWLLRHHHSAQEIVGIVVIALIALVVAGTMFRWGARSPFGEAAPLLVLTVVIACALCVLVSPLAGGSYPFKAGAGDFFFKVWIFLGASLAGMLLGYIALVAVGRDYRTQALKQMERSRPIGTIRAKQKPPPKSKSGAAR
ncbi:MAG TPA: hypothetical protein VH442_05585 [Micromonosporaceae bacterium]|jgi:hypothetical protein